MNQDGGSALTAIKRGPHLGSKKEVEVKGKKDNATASSDVRDNIKCRKIRGFRCNQEDLNERQKPERKIL